MIEAVIAELQRGAAKRDRALVINGLVGDHRVRVLELLQALLGTLVSNHRRAGILEGLAAGDVIEVVVTVDQVPDRRLGDFPDLVNVLLSAIRTAIGDRVGGDHPFGRDDEHRLMVAVAEDVDVFGAVDLSGLDLRGLLRRWLVLCGGGHRRHQSDRSERSSQCSQSGVRHCQSSLHA